MEQSHFDELNDLMQRRMEEYEELLARGVQPFAYAFDVDAEAAATVAAFSDDAPAGEVRLAGRIMTMRRMGKASFAHMQDHTGRIQIYLKKGDLGDAVYDMVKLLDIGDVVGVRGTVLDRKSVV